MRKFFILTQLTFLFLCYRSSGQDSTASRTASTNGLDTTKGSASLSSNRPKMFAGKKQFKAFSVGADAGVLVPIIPLGGLNQFSKYKYDLAYGGFLKYQISHAFGIRLDYLGGKLSASNAPSKQNVGFSTPPGASLTSETMLTYAGSVKGELDVASLDFFKRKNFIKAFITAGYGLAGFKPKTSPTDDGLNNRSLKIGFLPIGAGLKFKISESFAINIGYEVYFFDGQNLLGLRNSINNDHRQSKASYGHGGIEYTFGKKRSLVWVNPVAVMYDELRENDSIAREVDGVKTRITSVEGDMANFKKDTDGDGVSDIFDKCPNTPAGNKVDGSGCNLPAMDTVSRTTIQRIVETDIQIVREAVSNLTFQNGKAVIDPSSFPSLDRVADLLNQKGSLNLSLKGYTDNLGSKAANIRLSAERARAVKDYMITKGIVANRIEAKGYGPKNPIASNKTSKGRSKNRRVEFNLF